MINYSPIAYAFMRLDDISAPGALGLTLKRISATEIEGRVLLPTTDVGGGPLTGMSRLIIAMMPEQAVGINPFAALDGSQLEGRAYGNGGAVAIIHISGSEAGDTKTTRFPDLTLGVTYWVAAVIEDNS